ncbi:hypothetical protein E2C01_019897 [Portunus trituberculatus]|uniref:Uncharacterized protein n=1 Tax=Portunus trituberculatus TaxID=210409 RepID=A0A5B7DYV1_PORTR|nr:hypothetical protein [Portunus trituberculatus]
MKRERRNGGARPVSTESSGPLAFVCFSLPPGPLLCSAPRAVIALPLRVEHLVCPGNVMPMKRDPVYYDDTKSYGGNTQARWPLLCGTRDACQLCDEYRCFPAPGWAMSPARLHHMPCHLPSSAHSFGFSALSLSKYWFCCGHNSPAKCYKNL